MGQAYKQEFNDVSGATAMTLALTMPRPDEPQQPQTVTTELYEYYNPLSASNAATAQNMILNIPNVAPAAPEVQTLAMTAPGAPDGNDINKFLANQAQMDQQNLTQVGSNPKASPIIELGTPSLGDRIVGNTFRVISFREILDTGNVPQHPTFSIAGVVMGNYSMDLGAKDEFTKGLEKVQQETLKEIQNSPEMQKLLDKPSWSTEDRKNWERELSGITSQKMGEVFGEYRSAGVLPNGALGKNKEVERHNNLNDLSIDLKNNTRKIEFDCEAMSIVKGMVMQRAEDKLLPPSSSEGGLKTATEYRYTTSGVDYRGSLSGHAFILSPATMDIIEGTSPIPEQNVDPGNNLTRFSLGQPLLTDKFGEGNGDFHGLPRELDGYRKEVSFLESLDSAEKMSGAANYCGEKLQNNDGIKNAEETLKKINTPGVDKDVRNDMNDMIKQALEDPALKDTMGTLKSALGFAKEKWTNLFNQVAGDPQMSAVAKDSFQQNFINKLGNSTLPVDDGKGGFTTLGESVNKWAQEKIKQLDKAIAGNAPTPASAMTTPAADQGAGLVNASVATTALTEDFNARSGATVMTLALTAPHLDAPQPPQAVTTELREYYNPLSAGNAAAAQNMTLNIPNVAPVTPEVQTLALQTTAAAPATMDTNSYVREAQALSAQAANMHQQLIGNPSIINAIETLQAVKAPGMPEDAIADMKNMIQETLEYPDIKSDMNALTHTIGSAGQSWQSAIDATEGNPQMSALAKDNFQKNFVNKLADSSLPIDDGNGGFKSLGETVREWAKPQLDKLDKTIANAPKIQAQAPKAEQMALS